MNKLAIFDLDGTVLDSLEDICDCLNVAFERFGYPKYSYAYLKKCVGLDSATLVNTALGGNVPIKKCREIWDYFASVVAVAGTKKSKVFDGIKEVLVELKKRGYYLSLFTNKTEVELAPFIPKFLNQLGFDDVVAVGGTDRAKPSPKEVFRLLSQFSVEPKNTYLIGDGETDILTALNAKVNPVAVAWGNRTEEQLRAVGAQVFVTNPLELLSILN